MSYNVCFLGLDRTISTFLVLRCLFPWFRQDNVHVPSMCVGRGEGGKGGENVCFLGLGRTISTFLVFRDDVCFFGLGRTISTFLVFIGQCLFPWFRQDNIHVPSV